MTVQTSPGYVHLQCIACEELINVPVNIHAHLVDDPEQRQGYLGITVELIGIDMQPMYDHKFEKHMSLFEEE